VIDSFLIENLRVGWTTKAYFDGLRRLPPPLPGHGRSNLYPINGNTFPPSFRYKRAGSRVRPLAVDMTK
jgi:hypothetical protein